MELPARQLEALQIIARWREGFLNASSIVPHLGVASESGARVLLTPLEQKGLIERVALAKGLPKSIHLTRAGREFLGLIDNPPSIMPARPRLQTPVIPVRCGALTASCTEADYATHPHVDWRNGDYYAYAKGDSMWDKSTQQGIREGTKTLMRPGEWPSSGQVVHICITDSDGVSEETMKVFHQCPLTGSVTLQAINPDYPDIVLPVEVVNNPKRVEIYGVAVDNTAPVKLYPRRDRK